jgi:Immunity protein 51
MSDEFAPLKLIETSPGNFSLLLTEFTPWAETFEAMGYPEAGGYAWHGVADALVRWKAPKLKKKFNYDPESRMFAAYGKDRDALVQFATLILAAMADPAVLKEAIERANPELMD